jgi:hypothetical protein
MHLFNALRIAFVFLLALANPVAAQIEFEDTEIPEFRDLADDTIVELAPIAPDDINNVGQSVINGQVVNPRDFPAVLRMRTGGTCTASLVGTGTIFIAAHCVDENTRIVFVSGDQRVSTICEIAPTYNTTTHANDFALCLLQRSVKDGIIPFETLDTTTKPSRGDVVTLTGYGCTRRGGPLDGRLRIGTSVVVDRPSKFRREPSAIFTRSDLSQGEAVLCPGDSGGPLFEMGDDTAGPRTIKGVNSRTTYEYGVSIFSATASSQGRAFITDWAERHNQLICGVNRDFGCK